MGRPSKEIRQTMAEQKGTAALRVARARATFSRAMAAKNTAFAILIRAHTLFITQLAKTMRDTIQ